MPKKFSDLAELYIASLNLSGVGVNFLLMVAPSLMERYSCVEQGDHYFEDLGKQLFWTLFACRFLVIPVVNQLVTWRRGNPILSTERAELLEEIENETVDIGENVVFSQLFANHLGIGKTGMGFSIVLSCWPLIPLGSKILGRSFQRGSHFNLVDGQRQHRWAVPFEFMYSFITLAAALVAANEIGFNTFYDTTHNEESGWQQPLALLFISGSGLFAVFAMLQRNLWQYLRGTEALTNIFYFSFMIITSSVDCVHPELMNGDGFKQTGIWLSMAAAVLSLPAAIYAARITASQFGHNEAAATAFF